MAFGDLRRNLVNICTDVLTPITLPIWDHLAQMAQRVCSSPNERAFLEGDRVPAYKQFPIDPKFANLPVSTARDPSSGKWMGFDHNAILLGAVSAVLRYNCFPH